MGGRSGRRRMQKKKTQTSYFKRSGPPGRSGRRRMQKKKTQKSYPKRSGPPGTTGTYSKYVPQGRHSRGRGPRKKSILRDEKAAKRYREEQERLKKERDQYALQYKAYA